MERTRQNDTRNERNSQESFTFLIGTPAPGVLLALLMVILPKKTTRGTHYILLLLLHPLLKDNLIDLGVRVSPSSIYNESTMSWLG